MRHAAAGLWRRVATGFSRCSGEPQRLARTGLVLDSPLPSVLELRITTGSAHYAWRQQAL